MISMSAGEPKFDNVSSFNKRTFRLCELSLQELVNLLQVQNPPASTQQKMAFWRSIIGTLKGLHIRQDPLGCHCCKMEVIKALQIHQCPIHIRKGAQRHKAMGLQSLNQYHEMNSSQKRHSFRFIFSLAESTLTAKRVSRMAAEEIRTSLLGFIFGGHQMQTDKQDKSGGCMQSHLTPLAGRWNK